MMIYGNLRTAIAVTGMCFLVSVPAQAATVGEALDSMGDMFVLENMCPDLYKSVEPINAYLIENGITENMMSDTNFYEEELEASAKRSFAARKLKSKEKNCADALELYGSDGSIVKGVFLLQSERGNNK